VIILAIVSNIILWNYEMSEVDWEKMKESVSITKIESTANSSWFTATSGYTINTGALVSGSFVDTKVVDGDFERFTESSSSTTNVTLVNNESFEGSWLPTGWSETTGSSWNKESNYAYDGSHSADFDGDTGGLSGYLTSPVLNCSNTGTVYVDFWWEDRALDDGDFVLQYYNGVTWSSIQDLNQLSSGNGWHRYTQAVTDSQYLVSNFQIRWWANALWSGETACVDAVTIRKSAASGTDYSFGVTGGFGVDLSAYPVNEIKGVEIQLRYRASDSTENWYLQAYNWGTSAFSDIGFNSTIGNTPSTDWDYYAVNLTDLWQNYVHDNGTINIRLVDQDVDSTQTNIDIDFLGVRVNMNGAQFTFKNDSGLTVHLVSLWVITSTEHQHYDINLFINSAETKNYMSYSIPLPDGDYKIKVVTERGNIAVFS
jgi:hypothetical protein